jgi:2-keto-4-pentenoate hydratase
VNNQIETSTTGAALGDPFNSVAWIANFLNKRGRQLKANELIMTGSTFATMFPKSGDTISYEVTGIGAVELKVSE